MSEERRVFSEKQASEILARAAKLQEGQGDYAAGLTRDELLAIAAEAGIEPRNLDAAIQGLAERRTETSFLNLVETDERVVDAELDPEDFDVVLDAAKTTRQQNAAQQVGRTLTMQARHKGGLYRVEVVSRNGRTRLSVRSIPLIAYFATLHPALLVAFIAGVNLAARGHGLAALALVLAVMTLGILGFVALVRRGKSRTSEFADLIEARVREATRERGAREGLRAVDAAPAVGTARLGTVRQEP